uniref:NADH-ubiquinone oxidoreductase chain 3 n=1 Tax=Dimorphostylis asiatica TaxID=2840398 RepID=A0A8F8FFB3_9CRUS|nr:NADH dehydrogenase subunit 3 [Dimorphostylis asiatica]
MFMILIFMIIAVAISFLATMTSSSSKMMTNTEKLSPYECGFDSIGMNRLQFSLQFFMISVIFLVFDVEICLIFPLMFYTKMSNLSVFFITSQMFMIILLLSVIHEWNQGILNWKS